MKINFSFYIFLIVVSFNSFNLSYIVIPFKTPNKIKENQNEEFDITKFYQNYFGSQIYAKMEIGNPKKVIQVNLLMNSHGLILGYLFSSNTNTNNNNNLIIEESNYDINKSISFYADKDRKIFYNQISAGFIGQDSFYFYSDIKINSKNEIKLSNISFIYLEEETNKEIKNDKICGNLGLALRAYYYLTDEVNFIKILKKMNYINKYDFSFYFTSDNEGLLIIGEEPHNYFPNVYNENNLRKTNVLSDGFGYSSWKIEFTQIYFYSDDGIKNKIKEAKNGLFVIENNYIIGSKYYKKLIEEKFFKKYLDDNICYYEKIQKEKQLILICDKTKPFDINSFPTLYFYHRIFNYTFELTKEDLFLEKNNKYIFLIFFAEFENNYFTLGKIFIRKYLFVFNIDSKTIGFYNRHLENEFNEKEGSVSLLNKLIGIFIILIASFIGFFLAKKLYEQARKRRLNEINEQYEYKSHDTDNINYENNDNKKIMLEIPMKS